MNPAATVCPPLHRFLALLLTGWLCGCAAFWPVQVLASGDVVTLVSAQRQIDLGPWQQADLPDWPLDPPVSPPPARVRYLVGLPPQAAAHAADVGLLIPGLLLNGSIRFNGHLLHEAVDKQGRTLPRGLDRLVVLSLPAGLWRPESNTIEIDALGQNRMSLARMEVGALDALVQKHRMLVLTRYVSPLVAGGVVGSLGLAMLALWWRLRDPAFVLFAVGALAWWLVNWMPLFAWPPIGGVPYAITWISLFGVVVAAFAAFCLRLANWNRPGLERSLLWLAAAGPLLLAGAYALGQMDLASSAWRLLLIGGVAIAFAAVSRAYVQTRSRASLAMVACGGLALVLGALDWLADLDETSNHPLLLTTYAGLAFAGTAAALLVVRYVEAARTSEALRGGLEERVRAQGAELRTALKDMEAARDLARAADRAKSSFLAVASHDLRQPAHAIGLYLEAMPAEGLGDEQREVLERLRESHRALERMFDALLDMSQIDAGTLTPQLRTLSPWALLQRLADEAAPAAEGKGLRLALRAGQGAAEAQVHTDALLLERMLRNLIGNAVKYTQAGGVLLACRLRTQSGVRCLRLEVWDSGAGIAPADADRVFEEFYRVCPGRSATDGLGLGLPIVKRLARLLGIGIGFRSRWGHGSCFSLELPLATPGAPMPDAEGAPVRHVFEGLRVGVLEDDPPVRDAMARVLRRWGCRVYAAADAAQLAAAAGPEAGQLELLVVDYALAAGATGPGEAQAYLAAHGAIAKVLVVTGEQTPERLRDLATLQLPWLPKPASTQALRSRIAALLTPASASEGDQHG